MFKDPKQMGRCIVIAAAIGLCSAAERLPAKPPKPPADDDPVTYTPVELSSIAGWAGAINQLDGVVEIVGYLSDNPVEVPVQRAHYWMVDPAGNVLSTDLQTLPPTEAGATVSSRAYDVSNQGVLVGYQIEYQGGGWGPQRPLLWPNAASDPIELPLPEGSVLGALATSINDEGIVVGATPKNPNGESLVAWRVAVVDGVANVRHTQTILTAPNVYPWQVVNSGYVCATVDVSTDPEFTEDRAFRLRLGWDNDQVWEVEGSRTQLFDVWSTAKGINEAGTVCGRCANPTPGYWGMAYVMTVSGELLDLTVLPAMKKKGFSYDETYNEDALSLNNSTPVQIVGQGSRAFTQGTFQGSEKVPLRWDGETSVTDLRTVTEGSPDLMLLESDINDAGWITAVTKGGGAMPALPVVLIPSR